MTETKLTCGYRLCRKKLRQDDSHFVVHVAESHNVERWAPGTYCNNDSCWQLEKAARAELDAHERQRRISDAESVVGAD